MSGEFSLGLTIVEEPLRSFVWDGFVPDGGYLLNRLGLVLVAVALALVPAFWFHRFDPDRVGVKRTGPLPEDGREVPYTAVPYEAAGAGPSQPPPGPGRTQTYGGAWGQTYGGAQTRGGLRGRGRRRSHAPDPNGGQGFGGPPTSVVRPGRPWGSALTGELRILLQGTPWWWWLGTAAVTAAAFATSASGVTRIVLPAAWLWPVLIWSRLGAQRHEHGVEALLAAYPAPRRRTFAEWTAGLTVTVLTGLGPLIRMTASADWAGVTAWSAGAVFIASLAQALGTVSRGHRLFQAGYLPLWYAAANGVPMGDFMGAVRENGVPAGPHPAFVAGLAGALVAATFAIEAARRRPRR
ncbi:hypothetical protein ACWEFL_15030 [Streptomyces sp. NPDC004838]